MGTIEEGLCRDDSDCSEKQYCYYVSETCVDYTQCSRYNRQENYERRARHSSQCGPCLLGYTAEKLGTGEMAPLCKKSNAQDIIPDADRLDNHAIIYSTVGVLLSILFVSLLASCLAIFLKKRASKRQGCNSVFAVVPTAPPVENSPFIDRGGSSSPIPFNNNKNLKDKNNLVRAVAYTPPDWIRANPNYEIDSNIDNMDTVEQLHSVTDFSTDNQPNDWASEQLTLQVTNGNLHGYEIEEVDNSLNTILVQNNTPSPNPTEENSNNNNNNSSSTSESNNAQSSRERVRASNIFISQKISMNVNLLNDDC